MCEFDPELEKELVEEGRVSFLYRPKVDVEEPQGQDDVQRFHMIMSPAGREGVLHRLVIIGKKRLPDISRHERFFGFVDAVSPKLEDLTAGLGPKEYKTKTRGQRRVEPARALGEGAYAITDRGATTRFDYELEIPPEPGEVQAAFRIGKTGEYIISVRNPERPAPCIVRGAPAPEYPEEKEAEFKGRAWISVKDPELLDFPGTQLLLIGARPQPPAEVAGELERKVRHDMQALSLGEGTPEDEALIKTLRQDIKAEEVPVDPAVKREWE